jgi:hypothetical protein
MSKEDIVFTFSYLFAVLGIAIPMAAGLFLRDIERDLLLDIPLRPSYWVLLMRLLARIAGSTAGAWYASVVVVVMGYPWLMYPAIGIGSVMGWKILDVTARVTIILIRKPIKELIKYDSKRGS